MILVRVLHCQVESERALAAAPDRPRPRARPADPLARSRGRPRQAGVVGIEVQGLPEGFDGFGEIFEIQLDKAEGILIDGLSLWIQPGRLLEGRQGDRNPGLTRFIERPAQTKLGRGQIVGGAGPEPTHLGFLAAGARREAGQDKPEHEPAGPPAL